MIYFHPYYIQEGPVRSIIIINIIVIVVIIDYCYRIIVISCPQYLCVVFLVSITQQKKGWYSWLYSLAGTIKTNQNSFFFVTTTLFSPHPHPLPPPLHTEIVVQFYPWSKFYFLLFQTHYHTLPYPKTYLPWQEPTSVVDYRDSIFNFPPLPNCQQLQ